MTKSLVLVERGIPTQTWMDFACGLDRQGDCLVFTEEAHPNPSHVADLNVEVRAIGDYVLLGSPLDGMLYSDASELVYTWLSRAPLSECYQALEYDGLSLWELGVYEAEIAVFKVLKRIKALSKVLMAEKWDRVHSLENWQELRQAFSVAATDVGLRTNVQRVPMRGSSILYHRLFDWTASGWRSQVARDVYFGLRSHPRPRLRSQYRSKVGSRPYLFLVNGYAPYLFTLLPVIQRIRASHEVLVINASGVTRAPQLQEQGIEMSYCTQHVPLAAWMRILRRTRELSRLWNRLEKDPRFPTLFEYQGRSLESALRAPLRKQFVRMFPRILTWAEALKRIFESARPRALVTAPDRYASARVAIELARLYGVPSLTVQPALINDHPHYGPVYADKMAAIDEYSRRVFLERGRVAPERVVVTGLPRWDGVPQVVAQAKHEPAQRAVRDKLGLDTTDRLVVFATENIAPSLTKRMIQAVMDALLHYPSLQLVIKLHPAESLESYEDLLDNLDGTGHKPIVASGVDLHPLLATSELVVAWFSNVVLEAAMLDKTVLVVNLSGEPDPLPFVQHGIALGAYSEEEIALQFDRIMRDLSSVEQLRLRRQQYMRHNPQLLDGMATERVVSLLREMAE